MRRQNKLYGLETRKDKNMKLKKILISILIMIMAIGINSKSSAKYVIEYTKTVAEITINN